MVSLSDFLLTLGGLVVLVPLMALAWLRQRRTGNAGIVDLIWTASLGGLGVAYAVLLEGWAPRRALVGALVGLWSVRLTVHLWQRVMGEPEDGRYAAMRREWPDFERWIFWFFQAQAVLSVLLSLVFLVLCAADEPGWRPQDLVAVALFVLSIVGEGVADRQLAAWRADPANRGKTCREGLWAWSRHPNYFFEWLHWIAYPVIGLGLPYGWTLWSAPLLMLFLVIKVTGIPPTEAQALRSRGDDYRAYQRTTNAFFPGPPRPDPLNATAS